jgi:hypothetical protein
MSTNMPRDALRRAHRSPRAAFLLARLQRRNFMQKPVDRSEPAIPKPTWRPETLAELIDAAFADRTIRSEDDLIKIEEKRAE